MAPGVESGKVRKIEVSGYTARLRHGVDPKGQIPQELEATPEKVEQATVYMTRVAQGDRQAFGMLHQHCVQPIAAFFRRHPLGSQTVEDFTQEVFFRVWEQREKYHPGTPDLPYLLGFARVILKETQRKLYPKQTADSYRPLDGIIDGRKASPGHQAELREQTQILQNLMDRLPEKQRQAVELVYLKGLTSREASIHLGCSDKTVRVNCHIGLTKLQAWGGSQGMVLAQRRQDRQGRLESELDSEQ